MDDTETTAGTPAATTTATPASYVVPAFLAALFGTLLKDENGVLQPVVDNYLTSVINDPSPDNVAAQSMAFPVQAATVLPKAESVGILDTATAIKNFIDVQVPSLVAKAQAAVTAAAAGTSTDAA